MNWRRKQPACCWGHYAEKQQKGLTPQKPICKKKANSENNFWKTVQQPAKTAISHNGSAAEQKRYEDAICFKGPVQLELTVLVFHPVSCTHTHTHTHAHTHVQQSTNHHHRRHHHQGNCSQPAPRSLKPSAHSQLCYWVSSHNGLRRAIEIRCCTYTKVGWDNR